MAAKQPASAFFLITVTQQHDWLSFISLHWKPVPRFLLHFSLSPPLSLPSWVSQILFVRSKWLCVQRQGEKEGMRGRLEMLGSQSQRWGGRGGCRMETSCSDVTSAAGRQDGRGKLPCAERRGRTGRKLNVWEGKNDFLSRHAFVC